jgi:hypothetical protein
MGGQDEGLAIGLRSHKYPCLLLSLILEPHLLRPPSNASLWDPPAAIGDIILASRKGVTVTPGV